MTMQDLDTKMMMIVNGQGFWIKCGFVCIVTRKSFGDLITFLFLNSGFYVFVLLFL